MRLVFLLWQWPIPSARFLDAHLNPAVSMGALVAGRISVTDFIGYSIFQTIGAIIAAGAIFTLATNSAGGYDVAASGMGQNGWGAGYGGEFFMISAFIFEVIATAVFLVVILGVTSGNGSPLMAGLVIGLTLTMIHLVGITITGTSVNPARSVGPALFGWRHGIVTALGVYCCSTDWWRNWVACFTVQALPAPTSKTALLLQ